MYKKREVKILHFLLNTFSLTAIKMIGWITYKEFINLLKETDLGLLQHPRWSSILDIAAFLDPHLF